jgi:hypothetical protein
MTKIIYRGWPVLNLIQESRSCGRDAGEIAALPSSPRATPDHPTAHSLWATCRKQDERVFKIKGEIAALV